MLEIFNEFIPIFSTTQDELEEKSLLSEICLGVDTNARGTTRNLWLRGERRRRGNCGRRRDLGSIYVFTQYLSSDRFRRGASRVSDDSVKSIGAVFVKSSETGSVSPCPKRDQDHGKIFALTMQASWANVHVRIRAEKNLENVNSCCNLE